MHPHGFRWELAARLEVAGREDRPMILYRAEHDVPEVDSLPLELDLSARILCVVDIYDAISSDRPYRQAMVPAVITSILARDRGTRLCPTALDALHAVREEMQSETAAPV